MAAVPGGPKRLQITRSGQVSSSPVDELIAVYEKVQ